MGPEERENLRYSKGASSTIDLEETVMFGLLEKYRQNKSKYSDKIPTLLDIGCGTGEITRELTKLGLKVRGIDFSSVAVDIANKNGLDCEVVDVDRGIPYENSSFNFVWAGDLLEHVFDPIFLLQEMGRVLEKGGYLFLTVPNDLHIFNRLTTLRGKSYQEKVLKNFGQYKHHTFFSKDLLVYMLKKNSFSIVDLIYKCKYPLLKNHFLVKNDMSLLFTRKFLLAAVNR